MVRRFPIATMLAGVLCATVQGDVLLNDTFGADEPPFGDLSRYTVTDGPSPFISGGELFVTMFEKTSLFVNMLDLESQIPGESIHCISFVYRHSGDFTIDTTVEISIHAVVTETGKEIEPFVLALNRPFWNRCKYTLTQNGKNANEVGFWQTFDTDKKCPGAPCPDGTTPPWKITFDWLKGGKFWIEIDGQPLDVRMIRDPDEDGLAGDPIFMHEDGKITGVEVTVKELGAPFGGVGPASLTIQMDSMMVDSEHQGSGTQAITMTPDSVARGALMDVSLTTDQPLLIPGFSTLEMGPEVLIHDFQVLSPTQAIATIQVDPRASNAGHRLAINNGEHLTMSDFTILPPGALQSQPNEPPALQVLGPAVVPANTPFTIDSLWQDPDDLFILGVLVVMEQVTTNEVFDGGYFFVDSSSGLPVLVSFEVPGLPPGAYKIAAVVNDGLSSGAMAAAFFIVVACAPCPGDLNGDGATDGADLGLLLGNWSGAGIGDLNGDGVVNGADFGLLLGEWGPCPLPPPPVACGDPCAGDCFASHDSPYCIDAGCCEIVCGIDGFCCDVAWDGICANEASQLCAPPVCGMSNTQDCCVPGALPGCNDQPCCEAVCAVDAFCCDVAWDGICAGEAQDFCGDLCPPPSCGTAVNDCFTQSGTPFCSDKQCCLAVCTIDPFCCDVAWDGTCVFEAQQFCVSCPGFACDDGASDEGEVCGADINGGCNVPPGGTSNCCVANGGLGCDNPACQAAVCAVDSFCCDVAWDGLCAGEATELCGDLCPLGVPSFGSIACGQTICGTGWALAGTRDTDWFQIEIVGATEITLSATAQFAFIIGVVDTGGVPDCSLASNLNPFALGNGCDPAGASFTTCLTPGTWWLFFAPTVFDGYPCGDANLYELSLTCGGPCVAASCGDPDGGNDCFTAVDTPYCSDAACCKAVCAVDPFCCDVAWDSICVDEAGSICLVGGSNCCFANGGIGCDDDVCEACVCGPDPFCCDVAWDGLCAGAAGPGGVCADSCPCSGRGSNCCVANGGLGCDDPRCQSSVCAVDPFCCDVAWDSICANEAAADPNCPCGG